jgi:hypothetical protein
MNSSHANAEAEDEDLIDFVPPPEFLARPRPATKSSLPLAITLALGVTAIAAALLWLNRGGPAPANAAPVNAAPTSPLYNVESAPAETVRRLSLFELPPYDEAQAARDLAAGRVSAAAR